MTTFDKPTKDPEAFLSRPVELTLKESKSDNSLFNLDRRKKSKKYLSTLEPFPPQISNSAPASPQSGLASPQSGLITPASSANRSQTSLDHRTYSTERTGGVSSRRTVIIIATFLVVGFIFVVAGIIVLWIEHHFAFRIAGVSFLAIGILSFIWCLFLQQKNFKKFVHELEKDMYFGHIVADSHVVRRLLSYEPAEAKKH